MNTQTKARQTEQMASEAPEPQLPAVTSGRPQIAIVSSDDRPRVYPAKIARALLAITRQVGAITKEGENKFHKYFYQKWEDVLDRLSPLLAENGLIIIQSEITRGLFDNDRLMSITYDFTIVNEEGDVWPERPVKTAISRLVDSKGVADDKAANKCHTQAHKYFLLQLFKIKTRDAATDDSDGDAPPAQRERPKAPNPNAPAAPKTNGPREIPRTRSTTFQSFADDYLGGATTATTLDDVKQWEVLNEAALDILETRAPEVYKAMAQKVAAHASKLAQGTKPLGPRPPSPDGPSGPPPEFANWREETVKALGACETVAALADVHQGRMLPANGKVTPEDWQAVAGAYRQAFDRLCMES